MKLTCTIYILISFFAKNKENFLVRCIAYFDKTELVHLSQNLNHFECLQLMKAMDMFMLREDESSNYGGSDNELTHLSVTPKVCLAELQHWNNDFPGNTKLSRRFTMELTLKWLGRPDLAKYVKENHNLTKTKDTKDDHIIGTLEFPVHKISRRHISKNDKHSSTSEKKKQKPHKHSQSVKKKKRPQKPVAMAAGHSVHKTHKLSQKENQSRLKKDYIEQHRSICCSILSIIFFIIFCFVAVYFLQRRNRLKIRGTKFKKILEKSTARKRKKSSNIFHEGCRQCICCKCNLNYQENMSREKEEEKELLNQSRAMRIKQGKRRKMELQKVESDPNGCLEDTRN